MENGTEGEWGDKDKIKFVTLLDSVQGQNRSRASLWKVEDAGAWTTLLKGNQAEEVTHSRLKSWKGGGVPGGYNNGHGTCFWHGSYARWGLPVSASHFLRCKFRLRN